MSEETAYVSNWKEEVIAEYAKLEIRRKQEEKLWEENITIKLLQAEVKKALDKLEEVEKQYRTRIDALTQQQSGIKLKLVDRWDITEKTFECTAGIATLRTTKSLHIRSKEKLVAFLELNKKLTDFIKSFEITKLRKIKDAGMLEDEICIWDEKKSIAIKIAEADQ